METRANYLIIGVITLGLIVGAFLFVLWLASGGAPTFDTYRVYFRGAVDGLGIGSDVRYSGIKVGSVSKITLDQDDPSRVKVEVQVQSGTPVREDSVAELAQQGITGISYIQITSGYGQSPLLKPKDGERFARIPSRQTNLQEVIQSLPDVLKNANHILEQVGKMVNEDNQKKLSSILDNVEGISLNIKLLTGQVAAKSDEINGIIDNLNKGAMALGSVADNVNSIVGDVKGAVGDVRVAIGNAKTAIGAIEKFSLTLRDLLQQNRQPISEFVSGGLAQFTRLVAEARQLVATYSRIGDRIDSDPARFLLGTQRPEYAPR